VAVPRLSARPRACLKTSDQHVIDCRSGAFRLGALFVLVLLMVAQVLASDVEIKRLPVALSAMPWLKGALAPFNAQARDTWFTRAILNDDGCRQMGSALWKHARQGFLEDDRLLYWQRISISEMLRKHPSFVELPEAEQLLCLATFEKVSRGHDSINFKKGHIRLLVSGFDPFLLDENIEQSNPSGLTALRLHDQVLQAQNGDVIHVQAVIFPVIFQDFDDGVVEALLEPLLRADAIDAFVSISMGRDAFDLERFPGRRRSASAVDNANRPSGGSGDRPSVPLLRREALEGPEFLEFSLPAERMREAPGRWAIRDNRTITSLEQGTLRAAQLSQLLGQTAVRGSGGGYLSNEIAYRALNAMSRSDSKIPMGHIHTPRMSTFDPVFLDDVYDQIKEMLIRLP
jgi:pyrrolidone-carboxylate peptidase